MLTLAVILVNGWTDAPNAIATAVPPRAIVPRPAILMAASHALIAGITGASSPSARW